MTHNPAAPAEDTPPPAQGGVTEQELKDAAGLGPDRIHGEPRGAGDVRVGDTVFYWPPVWADKWDARPGPWAAIVTAIGKWPPAEGDQIPGEVTLNVNLPQPTPVGEDPVQRMACVMFAGEAPAEVAADPLRLREWRAGRWTWPER